MMWSYMGAASFDQIRDWAKRLLEIAHPLATGPNTAPEPAEFPRLVEAAFRRDYLTLQTILYLSQSEPREFVVAFGNSCMDLSRRVLEDVISLEYIRAFEKEKTAKRFWDYAKVQDKQDLEYLKASGIQPDPEKEKIIEKYFEEVKAQFQDKSSRSRWKAWKELSELLSSQGHSIDMVKIEEEFDRKYGGPTGSLKKNWSSMDVETMIDRLVSSGKVRLEEIRTLLQGYSMGNDKNHMSPRDLRAFLDNADYERRGESDMKLALITTTLNVTKLADMLVEEMGISGNIAKQVDDLWSELLHAHENTSK